MQKNDGDSVTAPECATSTTSSPHWQKAPFAAGFDWARKNEPILRKRRCRSCWSMDETFIQTRLAPAEPKNDGQQTPMRGHPIFIAQHATATCCRGCLEKWHRIPRGREFTDEQIDYVLAVLSRWLNE